ncbi:family 43 glycosylhydrolase [Paenibacillus woosongensis]|uniref:Family 43 glycosylhydrolase n=1 Tax=Paenibacillus woosongensis TaxID=307580 RepID=A0AA95I9R7_9BACL|nr:family 43 glycosylhydrolase [Paenibacillus woosongensis]WHX50323.1 family 43 glycosylhydrolase [Paenibacillus woosongensis]
MTTSGRLHQIHHSPSLLLADFDANTSMISVADIYYAAVPYIEGLSGIRIYQSKDLIQWEHYTDILTDYTAWSSSADIGVWTPQLSYHDHQFYLTYTDTRTAKRPMMECHSYLMVADRIEGPWSEPICLNRGFGSALSRSDQDKVVSASEQ